MPPTFDLIATARFDEAASMEVTGWDPVANRLAFEAYYKPLFGSMFRLILSDSVGVRRKGSPGSSL